MNNDESPGEANDDIDVWVGRRLLPQFIMLVRDKQMGGYYLQFLQLLIRAWMQARTNGRGWCKVLMCLK